jgi:GAF domain-containing protein
MPTDKQQLYTQLTQQVEAIIAGENDVIANMANISAILYWALERVNWAGFYLIKHQQLVLGPFHGQPACIRIPIGTGVCGTAVAAKSIQLVDDVHQFSGHIACDAASNSEIVLPIMLGDEVFAVLDIDSPEIARFDQQDQQGLSKIVTLIEATLSQGSAQPQDDLA